MTLTKAEKRIVTKALKTYLGKPTRVKATALPPLYPAT